LAGVTGKNPDALEFSVLKANEEREIGATVLGAHETGNIIPGRSFLVIEMVGRFKHQQFTYSVTLTHPRVPMRRTLESICLQQGSSPGLSCPRAVSNVAMTSGFGDAALASVPRHTHTHTTPEKWSTTPYEYAHGRTYVVHGPG
jgi:hypothetical protein